MAVDRTGGMTFWVALEPYGPKARTMSFVNGSFRMGVMRDYRTYGDGDALRRSPTCRTSRCQTRSTTGSATSAVHTHLTIQARREPHGPAAVGVAARRPARGRLLEQVTVPTSTTRP